MHFFQVEVAAQDIGNSEKRVSVVSRGPFRLLLYSALDFGKLFHIRPNPPLRQLREIGSVGSGGFPVLSPSPLLRLPASAALGQDTLQQDGGGLVVAVPGAGQLRLGGDQAAFAGVLEDAGPVALEVGLDATEGGGGGVEAGELRLDGGDDAALLREGG